MRAGAARARSAAVTAAAPRRFRATIVEAAALQLLLLLILLLRSKPVEAFALPRSKGTAATRCVDKCAGPWSLVYTIPNNTPWPADWTAVFNLVGG